MFEIASSVAIAAHYKLDVCLDSTSGYYHIVQEIALLLNILVPKACSSDHLRRIKVGDIIGVYNHAYVFEDFYVNHGHGGTLSQANGTRMSLEDLFGLQRERLGDLYYLKGYRSSWKYLTLGSKIAEVTLKKQVFLSARESLKKLVPKHHRVAIHLRVGDASDPRHLYNFPGSEYFHEAMQHFRRKWEKVKFLVFSDNSRWCQLQSRLATKDIHIVESGQMPQAKVRNHDLALMSACDGVFTSLGTFGWWAGHFSFQNGGEVIYFKNTFNVSQVRKIGEVAKVDNFFPPEWIGIEAPALDCQGNMVQNIKRDVIKNQPG